MKHMKFLLTLGMVALVLGASTFVDAKLANMIGAWTFEEAQGDKTADVSGNGLDGTLMGNPEWTNGKIGGGLKINTTADYVIVEDDEKLHFEDKDFTWMAWINIDAFVADASAGILTKRNLVAGNGSPTLLWKVDKDTRALALDIRDDDAGNGINTVVAKTPLEEGEWYHVALVKDDKDLSFYLNGQLDDTINHDRPGNLSSTEPLYIGIHHYGTTWNSSLQGTIDEVAIFSAALSGADVRAAMENLMAVDPEMKLTVTWAQVKTR